MPHPSLLMRPSPLLRIALVLILPVTFSLALAPAYCQTPSYKQFKLLTGEQRRSDKEAQSDENTRNDAETLRISRPINGLLFLNRSAPSQTSPDRVSTASLEPAPKENPDFSLPEAWPFDRFLEWLQISLHPALCPYVLCQGQCVLGDLPCSPLGFKDNLLNSACHGATGRSKGCCGQGDTPSSQSKGCCAPDDASSSQSKNCCAPDDNAGRPSIDVPAQDESPSPRSHDIRKESSQAQSND